MTPKTLFVAVFVALVGAGCSASVEDDLLRSIPTLVDVDNGNDAGGDTGGGSGDSSDNDAEGFPDGDGLFNPDTGLPLDACMLLSTDEIASVTGIEFGESFGNPFQCTFGDISTGQAWVLLFFRTHAANNGDGNLLPLFDDDEVVADLGDRALWTPISETITIQIGNAIVGVSGKLFNGTDEERRAQATELALLVLSKT